MMALASYSTSPKFDVLAMALIGHDNNPNDSASPASGSNGWSFEAIFGPLPWLRLDARYERTNDGLGTIQNNFIGDIASNGTSPASLPRTRSLRIAASESSAA
jgi:hypothetical protein